MTNDKADFTQGNILKKLVAFMMPVLGALILQAAYGAVDLLVVGRFGSTSGLSAVSTGSQVLNLVTFVVTQFAMGITVLIARYLGEKRPERIGAVIGGGAVVFTMMSVALFIAMVGFARPISVLMQAPAEAVDLTASYVRICGAGIFFIVAYNLLSAIFRGLGDSKSPLLFVLVACIVNIIGDLVLVAGLHMDAAGAAIATVTAQALSVVFAVMLLLKKDLPFAITKKDFRLNPQCRKFLKIGLPLALQEFLTQISFLALCAFVNRLGLEASSGYGVACKIVNFAMLVPSSLMQSMASFVSQNIGAGKKKRAKQSMFTGIGVGLAVGCVVFVLVLFKGDVLCSAFSTDAAVIQNGFAYLKGFAPETLVTAIMFSMVGYFNGNNKTVWVMTQGLIQTLLVRLPLAYFMSIQPNASLTKIGLAAPVATTVGIVLNVGFFIYLNQTEQRKSILS
ncbi:MATE family efflux transporter [Blautia sp. 2744]|uniref:Probable multidrug resistance protein NorM n=1 Tax=Blautia intestinalis TaxID=2763028 RepID=A0ABR7I2J1_9FIRM|nr:MATE family efflux transporter [Blautia intestinalis]MBC5740739.1 MATE family efflux transporter [Blautia intestinalis]RHD29655.1 MATE family efflux transporter [Blautia obeum]